jgi:hypothetical protein
MRSIICHHFYYFHLLTRLYFSEHISNRFFAPTVIAVSFFQL